MRKTLALAAVLFNGSLAFCQNVGIGTTSPATLLQVGNFDGRKNTALTISTEGAYSTTPAGQRVAELKLSHLSNKWGFSIESNDLPGSVGLSIKTHNDDSAGITRMYIDRNTGNIGMGYTNPIYKLSVNGTGYFFNDNLVDFAALKGNSTVNSRFAPGVVGTGASIGVLGNANTVAGIGVMGYNNVSNANIQYIQGTGVFGFSTGGHGVAGVTTSTGYAGVFGSTVVAGGYAGQFFASDVAWALNTVGKLKLTGIGEAAGKVLTSDANGNATWQTPVGGSGGSNNISFSAYMPTSIDVVPGNTYSLAGLTTEFQLGNSFNEAEGLFIAPADGVYQLTARIGFTVAGTNPVYSVVRIVRHNTVDIGCEFNHTTPGSDNSWYQSLNYTKIMNLTQGENVYVTYKLTQVGANSILVSGDNTPNTTFLSIVQLQ